MFDPKILNDMAKEFTSHLPPAFSEFKTDFEKHLKHFMERCFSEMNLVTREEFDAQALLLSKTCAKLNSLEARLRELEGEVENENENGIDE